MTHFLLKKSVAPTPNFDENLTKPKENQSFYVARLLSQFRRREGSLWNHSTDLFWRFLSHASSSKGFSGVRFRKSRLWGGLSGAVWRGFGAILGGPPGGLGAARRPSDGPQKQGTQAPKAVPERVVARTSHLLLRVNGGTLLAPRLVNVTKCR